MDMMTKNAGHSARQRAGKKSVGLHLCAMVLAAGAFLFTACHEKTNGQTAKAETKQADSTTKPQVNIRVNRHYDDKGNVIGFDSTYTSFYSNVEGDTATMDSMMS